MPGKVKLPGSIRVARVSEPGDDTLIPITRLVDSAGRQLTDADIITSSSTAKDTKYINGIPVDKLFGKTGTLRPALTQQIYAALTAGATKNLVPDSDVKFGTVYWTLGGLSITAGAGILGGNGFTYPGTGAPSGGMNATSAAIDVTAGQTITISMSIDATYCSVNQPAVSIWKSDLSVMYAAAYAVLGVERRMSATFTVPAGITQVKLKVGTNNATVTNGKTVLWSNPQVEVGPTATAYKPNIGDDTSGYLLAGASQVDYSSSIHLTKGSVPPAIPTQSFFFNTYATRPAWQASHNYHFGDLINDNNNHPQVCISGGVSGSGYPFPSGVTGVTTADGSTEWICAGGAGTTPCFVVAAFGGAFTRASGAVQNIENFIICVFNLTAGSTYYIYLGFDEARQKVYAYGTDGTGNVTFKYSGSLVGQDVNQGINCAYTSRAAAVNAASAQGGVNVVALNTGGNLSVTIPASGTGTGGGGGYTSSGNSGCPHERQVIHTSKGYMLSGDLADDEGAELLVDGGHARPASVELVENDTWYRVKLLGADGERHEEMVSATHCYIGPVGVLPVAEAAIGSMVKAHGGGYLSIEGLEVVREPGMAVRIEMPDPHTYYFREGGPKSHNPLLKP